MTLFVLAALALAEPEPTAVVGGSPADPGEFPAVAALTYSGGFTACTGVLIHPEWVLTASHCAPNIEAIWLDTDDLSAPGELRTVDDFIGHPDGFTSFDVALVHLQAPSDVEPVPLALDCIAADWLTEGATVTLAGYGKTDPAGQVDATGLNAVDMPVVDPVCADDARGCNEDAMPAGEFIAGGDGIDSCTGDSGAPVFLEAADRTWVVGITSRAARPSPDPCGHGGIYVRTDAVGDWIETVTGIVLDRPDCAGLNRPPSLAIDPIVTEMHAIGETLATVTDAELDQTWALEVVEPPAHGTVGLDGDRLIYVPDPGFAGDDSFRVQVTDDGDPPESDAVDVPVTVTTGTGPSGCGCATGPGPTPAWLLLLLLGRRR